MYFWKHEILKFLFDYLLLRHGHGGHGSEGYLRVFGGAASNGSNLSSWIWEVFSETVVFGPKVSKLGSQTVRHKLFLFCLVFPVTQAYTKWVLSVFDLLACHFSGSHPRSLPDFHSPRLGSRFRVSFINRLTTNGYLLCEILKSNCYWFRADESSKKMDKFSTQHATDEWLVSRACSSKILKSQLDLKRSTTQEGKLAVINVFGIGPMPVELVSCGTPFVFVFFWIFDSKHASSFGRLTRLPVAVTSRKTRSGIFQVVEDFIRI